MFTENLPPLAPKHVRGRSRLSSAFRLAIVPGLACLAALLGGGCGSKASPGASSGHAISGSVSGEVRSGVTIVLSGAASRVVTTDGSGAYAFPGLAAGDYVVSASLADYRLTPYAGRQVTIAGADVSGQDFLASATHHAIRGTVSGAAAAGVQIAISGPSSETTTTAADGSYAFSNLADGTYTVTPGDGAHGFAPGARTVTLSGADAIGQDFVASAIASSVHAISGTVSGAVSAGVSITLRRGTGTVATTTTDGAGGYTFANLADGSYTITPALTGYAFAPRSLAVTLLGADARGEDFAATMSVPASKIGELATGTHIAYGIALGNDLNAWITDDVNGVVSRVLLQDSSAGARGDVQDTILTPSDAQPTAIALRYFGRRCFAETRANRIGCLNWDGSLAFTVDIPTPASGAVDIVNGPGADPTSPDMWFAEHDAGKVGRMSITEGGGSASGSIVAEYVLPPGCRPAALAVANDGNVWWGADGCDRIGWIDRSTGSVQTVDVEVGQPVSLAMNLGETGVWFVDAASDRLGRLTSTGGLSWFAPPVAGSGLAGVALGADEALYVTESAGNAVARFPLASFDPTADPNAGRITEELMLPVAGAAPFRVTAGTDGNVWFTERGRAMIGVVYMPTHCFWGKVTLADLTTPVPSVTMEIAPAGVAPSTTTTSGGDYSFCGLPPGSYTITPTLASRTFSPASLTVTMSQSNVAVPAIVAQ